MEKKFKRPQYLTYGDVELRNHDFFQFAHEVDNTSFCLPLLRSRQFHFDKINSPLFSLCLCFPMKNGVLAGQVGI